MVASGRDRPVLRSEADQKMIRGIIFPPNRIKELERENHELRQANEILKKASAYFAQTELDRPFRK